MRFDSWETGLWTRNASRSCHHEAPRRRAGAVITEWARLRPHRPFARARADTGTCHVHAPEVRVPRGAWLMPNRDTFDTSRDRPRFSRLCRVCSSTRVARLRTIRARGERASDFPSGMSGRNEISSLPALVFSLLQRACCETAVTGSESRPKVADLEGRFAYENPQLLGEIPQLILRLACWKARAIANSSCTIGRYEICPPATVRKTDGGRPWREGMSPCPNGSYGSAQSIRRCPA